MYINSFIFGIVKIRLILEKTTVYGKPGQVSFSLQI